MTKRCELCDALNSRTETERAARPGRLRRVRVEDRILALCDAHASQVRAQAPATISELRRAFTESQGKRSLFSRRAPLDRRAFPARPEGRRASSGRRERDSGA